MSRSATEGGLPAEGRGRVRPGAASGRAQGPWAVWPGQTDGAARVCGRAAAEVIAGVRRESERGWGRGT
ncbi:hypothetical protein IQ61_34730 [Streptomyces scabiei]|nr:hypothetical protein IQ61_34730 [Streptomyces scabiei]